MNILVICKSLRMESSIGAVPFLRQFVESLKPYGTVYTHETEKYETSKIRLGLQKYANLPYFDGQAVPLVLLPKQMDLVLIIHDYNWLRTERLTFLYRRFDISKLFFYDLEVPLNLPENSLDKRYEKESPFLKKTNRWDMLDGVIIPSLGAAKRVGEITSQMIVTNFFSVDPSRYVSTISSKFYDLCFNGKSRYYRKNMIDYMLIEPCKIRGYSSVGSSEGRFDFPAFIGSSKLSRINLNITRQPFAQCYGSSISRLFELAAIGCCIVSNPCDGMSEWFEEGKEVITVSLEKQPMTIYDDLLIDEERRNKMASAAFDRLMKDHTIKKRTAELMGNIFPEPNSEVLNYGEFIGQ